MEELFGTVLSLENQNTASDVLCGCELEDGSGGVGECYHSDCCFCERYSDD